MTLPGHGRPVMSADFSPDGKRVVTASHDKNAHIWDVVDRRLAGYAVDRRQRGADGGVQPGRTRLLTATYDGDGA